MSENKKRGRPVGVKSLMEVKLSELNAKFKPEDSIVVGAIFMRNAEKVVATPAPQVPDEVKSGIQVIEV